MGQQFRSQTAKAALALSLTISAAAPGTLWAQSSPTPQLQPLAPQTQTSNSGGNITTIIGTKIFNNDGGLLSPTDFYDQNYTQTVQDGYANGTISYSTGREEVSMNIRNALMHTELNYDNDPKVAVLVGDARSGRDYSVNQFMLDCSECTVVRVKSEMILQIQSKDQQYQAVKALLVHLHNEAKNLRRGRLIVYFDNVGALTMGEGRNTPAMAIAETIASKRAPDMILTMDRATNNRILQADAHVSERVTIVQQPRATTEMLMAQLRELKVGVEKQYNVHVSEEVLMRIVEAVQKNGGNKPYDYAAAILQHAAYEAAQVNYEARVELPKVLQPSLVKLNSQISSLESDLAYGASLEKRDQLDELKEERARIEVRIAQIKAGGESTDETVRRLQGEIEEMIGRRDAIKGLLAKMFRVFELRTINKLITDKSQEFARLTGKPFQAGVVGAQPTTANPRVVVTEGQIDNAARSILNIPIIDYNKVADQILRSIGRLVGQDHVIKPVAEQIRNTQAMIKLEEDMARRQNRAPKYKPQSFMFGGRTGTGKTDLTKVIARAFGYDKYTKESIIRFDMSEFMEKHTVSRLIGAPPGYAGFDEGGQLTDPIRENGHRVVLFDEIEKAHPDVMKILLQVLDDGRLTDGKGRTVDFRNVIVIMTTNSGKEFADMDIKEVKEHLRAKVVGSEALYETWGEDRMRLEAMKTAWRAQWSEEFVTRFTQHYAFKTLTPDMARQVSHNFVREIQIVAKETFGMEFRVSPEAVETLTSRYSPAEGARALYNAFNNELLQNLVTLGKEGKFNDGGVLVLDSANGNFDFGVVTQADLEREIAANPDAAAADDGGGARRNSMFETLLGDKPAGPSESISEHKIFDEKYMIRDAVMHALRKFRR